MLCTLPLLRLFLRKVPFQSGPTSLLRSRKDRVLEYINVEKKLLFISNLTLDDAPLLVGDGDGEAKHDSRRSVVAAVTEHTHAHPVPGWSTLNKCF